MRKSVLLIYFGLLCSSVFAQGLELFRLQSLYYPEQSVPGDTGEGKIGYKEFGFQFTLPQVLNDYKTILTHKVEYGHLITETEVNVNNVKSRNSSDYHTISYTLGLNQKLSDKWRIIAGLSPTLASDFGGGLGGDDFLIMANAMMVRTKSRALNYGFGLIYSTRFGRSLVLPFAMLNHTTPTRTIKVILPNQVSIMYNKTNKNVYYGAKAALNGGLFNLYNDDKAVNNVLDEAGYSRLNIGPAIAVRIKGGIYMHAFGGITVARRLEFIDVNENIIDRTPDNGPFMSIGIAYHSQPKPKKTDVLKINKEH